MNRAFFCFLLSLAVAQAAPHRYDHIVILFEENRTVTQIIGDRVNAPYINSLADGGVRLGSMFALVHPSQPNYIHMFSGNNQGIVDDDVPPNFSTVNTPTYPFRTPNLAAEIVAAGFTFAGYSEQIESAGATDWADYDPHSATHPGIYYRRKHSPWVNWVAKVSPIPPNQLPASVNLSFTNFPTDLSTLPTVSFVIPNQMHDMHDGSRKQGDDWLAANLDRYAQWARTNNSLLIITWDEDDFNNINQIPTVLYGAALRDGTVAPGTWTHHNMLRTIEEMYGTAHAGAAARVRPIVGPFIDDPSVVVKTFRQGLAGAAIDTQIWAETPTTAFGSSQDLTADLDTSSTIAGNQVAQVLIRFNGFFGAAQNQVPTNATIHSAKLIFFTPAVTTSEDSDDYFDLHRMLIDWTDTATWDSLLAGVSTDDVEAVATPTFTAIPEVEGAPVIFDVTSDIELFRTGTTNRGWVIRPASNAAADGWTFKSSEAADALRPTLEIVYSEDLTPYQAWARSFGLSGANAAPAADPDRDGAVNATEYACNMSPRVANPRPLPPNGTAGLPAPYYLQESGGVLEVEFLRRKGDTNLTYSVQFSSDLLSWDAGMSPTVTTINTQFDRVRVREAGVGPNPRRFARVIVALQ